MVEQEEKAEEIREKNTISEINMQYIYEVQDHFITDSKAAKLMVKLHTDYNNVVVKNEILKVAAKEFSLRNIKGEQQQVYLEAFEKYMWKYYRIEPLIQDKTITDIALYNKSHVTVRTIDNERYVTDVAFHDDKDYKRFILMTALKNGINLSAVNAQQVFVDDTSNSEYKLRVDIAMDMLNSSGQPYMHIRKNPKKKYSTEQLVEMGVMSHDEMKYIIDRFNNGKGMLIVGEGNSGKSTLLNALLDKANRNMKILVAQESDGELFSDFQIGHPDILFQKLIKITGEGGVSYTLGDLVEKGLVSDFDMYIIGEIKEAESAAKLLNASFTGSKAVTTTHGPDEFSGIEKLADYLHQATHYTYDQCLKFLRTFETVVFMKRRKLGGIAHIQGWNEKDKKLIIESVKINPDTYEHKLRDYIVMTEAEGGEK